MDESETPKATSVLTHPLDSANLEYLRKRLEKELPSLFDAVAAAVISANGQEISDQLTAYVRPDALIILAQAGIDPLRLFPLPVVIEHDPRVIGYYRLTLDWGKKPFYHEDSWRMSFQTMEDRGTLSPLNHQKLPELCAQMCAVMSDFVIANPNLTPQQVNAFAMAAFGVQVDGARRVLIGQQAETAVFSAFFAAVAHYDATHTPTLITLTNDRGEAIRITKQSDPDVCVWFPKDVLAVAAEIKGGTDRSNDGERVGAAMKSHGKIATAKRWVIIASGDAAKRALVAGVDAWFNVEEVRAQTGDDWDRFRYAVAEAVGIKPV